MAFAAREVYQFEAHKKCIFCNENTVDEFRLGKIFKYEDITVHYFCLLFASHLPQNGSDTQGILGFLSCDIEKELRNRTNTICTYCGKPGAVTICAEKGCGVKFHFPCGIRKLSFHLFYDQFQSFCFDHRKFQTPLVSFTTESEISSIICVICQNDIQPGACMSNVWASCCKTAWFHKDCVQRLALNAGYFFKCPNCNNENNFRNEMLQCGIYIPDQDAAWELEPNAFNDLLERHDSCDARICFSDNGRKFSRFRGHWRIILCDTCGSQGVHTYCGQHTHTLNKQGGWTCDVCLPVVEKKRIAVEKPSYSTDAQNISNLRISLSRTTSAHKTRQQENVRKAPSHNLLSSNRAAIKRRGRYHLRNKSRVSLAESNLRRMANQTHPLIDDKWKQKGKLFQEIVKKKLQRSRRVKCTISGTEVRIPSVYKQLLKNFHISVPNVSTQLLLRPSSRN